MAPPSRAVADLLRDLREDSGTSLREAARELGVDPSYLSRVERGSKKPSSSILDRAASYYDVPRDGLTTTDAGVPADIAQILRDNPELISQIRRNYGPR